MSRELLWAPWRQGAVATGRRAFCAAEPLGAHCRVASDADVKMRVQGPKGFWTRFCVEARMVRAVAVWDSLMCSNC
ncbi:hypothetical protein ATOBIA_N16920 [Atopobiaceae bacterium P1]|nr:hypothetical protein ATOBIA_N16920 [Atopobiaceae bacterium P1]